MFVPVSYARDEGYSPFVDRSPDFYCLYIRSLDTDFQNIWTRILTITTVGFWFLLFDRCNWSNEPKIRGVINLCQNCIKMIFIQGVFFNWASPENVSRLAPPKKTPWLAPPHFEKVLSMAAERGEIPNTLTFLMPRGGQSGTLTFFWNQSLTGQHLANSGEAQLKKSPCN